MDTAATEEGKRIIWLGNKELERVKAQRDELLDCVIEIETYWASGNFSRDSAMWQRFRAAIARATGA